MKVGEIRIIQTPDERRLGLIVACRDEDPAALVVLLTNAYEYATDSDILLRREELGLPYDLLAQTSLTGPVLKERLVEPLGFYSAARELLDPEVAERYSAARGLPVWERTDPRVAFKESEGRYFDLLQREALSAWEDPKTVSRL